MRSRSLCVGMLAACLTIVSVFFSFAQPTTFSPQITVTATGIERVEVARVV